MTTRFLTWNIGSFHFLKFGSYLGLKSHDSYEYYQPTRNSSLVSNFIESINPDFLYLQEFYHPKDEDSIEYLKEYPHRMFMDMWYRKKGAMIASKKPFEYTQVAGEHHVNYGELKVHPVHFNSFSPTKRHVEARKVIKNFSKTKKTIVFGDTNIWNKRNSFLFSKDKHTYRSLKDSFVDVSKECTSTTFMGFGLDKIFTSTDMVVQRIESPKVRGKFMDHYPIYVDVLH